MAYSKEDWKNRLTDRSDLSTSLVHLTKNGTSDNVIDNLFKILNEQKLNGSTTKTGFIIGTNPAVCFQDTPFYGIAQNILFEQKINKQNNISKVRYMAVGLAFEKEYVFNKGGRPVLYEKTAQAKEILPKEEWWRIVNFDLSNQSLIIDWTHEREWRCKNHFEFEISEVIILLANESQYRTFMKKCENDKLDLHQKIKGIVVMNQILR
jgi:hypothetical protein